MEIIQRRRINDVVSTDSDWVVNEFVCPSLTLLSGQPKQGKSMLVGHIANALINQNQFLNREVKPGNHTIGWMGFDAGWDVELKERWSESFKNQCFLYDPPRNLDVSKWEALADALVEDQVSLFVIDHLYGLAGNLDLNNANEVSRVLSAIRPIYVDRKIPTILIAQAGKNAYTPGRAAHSVALEGEARMLLRLHGKQKNGIRSLDVQANTTGELRLKVKLSEVECNLTKDFSNDDESNRQARDAATEIRKFLALVSPEELTKGAANAGRAMVKLGMASNDEAGRSKINRAKKMQLLEQKGKIVSPGPSLLLTA